MYYLLINFLVKLLKNEVYLKKSRLHTYDVSVLGQAYVSLGKEIRG